MRAVDSPEDQETTETRKESYRQEHLPLAGQEMGEHLTHPTRLTAEPEQTEGADSTERPLGVRTGLRVDPLQWAEGSKWGQALSEPWRDRLQFENAASKDEPEAEH